jgi:hypothetical protein
MKMHRSAHLPSSRLPYHLVPASGGPAPAGSPMTSYQPAAAATTSQTVIPGFAGSATHRRAINLYERHQDGAGQCFFCGQPAPCPSRAYAAVVCGAAGAIAAAGDSLLIQAVPAPSMDRQL